MHSAKIYKIYPNILSEKFCIPFRDIFGFRVIPIKENDDKSPKVKINDKMQEKLIKMNMSLRFQQVWQRNVEIKKYFWHGCADQEISCGYGSGSISKMFYGSGYKTDPTNFKKSSWDLIKSKYFQGQILQ